MRSPETDVILSRLPGRDYTGREPELTKLCRLTDRNRAVRNAVVIGGARTGKTELLRKAYDILFFAFGDTVPIYYCFRSDRLEPAALARDFLVQFLSQFVAFRRNDPPGVWPVGETPESLASRALPGDYLWIKEFAAKYDQAEASGDALSAIAIAGAAPSFAAASTGLSPLLMLDDFHLLDEAGGLARAEFSRSVASEARGSTGVHGTGRPAWVLSGLQRVLVEMTLPEERFFGEMETIRLGPPSDQMLETVTAALAADFGVAISDSTIELMIQQLGRDLFYTRALIDAAASRNSGLKTFMEFERVYTEEVLDGRIGNYLDAVLRTAAPDTRSRRAAIEALGLVVESNSEVPLQVVTQRMGLPPVEAEQLLSKLNSRELLDLSFGFVRKQNDPVLWDYVRARYREWIAGASRPLRGSEMLGEKLKHSYRLMMSRYNRAVEAQLVELLSRFDFQNVPTSIFDRTAFDRNYEGIGRAQISRLLEEEAERIRLPQMVVVGDLGGGESQAYVFRMFLASGFEGGVFSESNEVNWLITLVNSKEPLDPAAIEAITQRMDIAFQSRRRQAAAGLFFRTTPHAVQTEPRTVRWYISKEGFTAPEAEALSAAASYYSTFVQLDLAYDYVLKIARFEAEQKEGACFELVIPIEDDAELIAARTVEQIARSADFDQESINQIKTALIEACLNAAEHSDSPDRKIHQKFTVTEDRLIIKVSSKGRQFSAPEGEAALVGSPKRGRGLQIIKALMDEVHFERSDDGSSLVMAKFLKQPESQP